MTDGLHHPHNRGSRFFFGTGTDLPKPKTPDGCPLIGKAANGTPHKTNSNFLCHFLTPQFFQGFPPVLRDALYIHHFGNARKSRFHHIILIAGAD